MFRPMTASCRDYLAAGVIVIPLAQPLPEELVWMAQGEVKWSRFSGDSVERDSVSQLLSCALDSVSAASVLQALRFLVGQLFVAATWRLLRSEDATSLMFRIFLVPYDLPELSTRLRARSDVNLKAGRGHLRALLLQVTQDRDLWDGGIASSSAAPPFLDQRIVSALLGGCCGTDIIL